ncbi:MAG: DNA adenine methylase [Desulfobaccales bacterium]
MTPKRPIIRYLGGKWRMANWIINHFPPHRIYVEPFGGAASVLLRKERAYAEVYNDTCNELCNLFQVMRDSGLELKEKLRLTPFARDEFVQAYLPSDNPLEQARRTIIRSYMGFGTNSFNKRSGFRSDCKRSGTTAAHDWRNYPDKLELLIDRLQGVVIENRDAFRLIAQHDSPETLFYIDPPYLASTRNYGSFYRYEFNEQNHRGLAAALNDCQGMVIVSGYQSSLYKELYHGWHQVERKTYADGNKPRVEKLWINKSAMEGVKP